MGDPVNQGLRISPNNTTWQSVTSNVLNAGSGSAGRPIHLSRISNSAAGLYCSFCVETTHARWSRYKLLSRVSTMKLLSPVECMSYARYVAMDAGSVYFRHNIPPSKLEIPQTVAKLSAVNLFLSAGTVDYKYITETSF